MEAQELPGDIFGMPKSLLWIFMKPFMNDLGTRFSGQYYVTSAVHRYTRRDGYITDFRVRRNAS